MSLHSRYAVALAVVGTLAAATATRAQVPSPTIEGPIDSPGAAFVASTTFDLTAVSAPRPFGHGGQGEDDEHGSLRS